MRGFYRSGCNDQWVPAFAALFRQDGGDWLKFYAAVERMGNCRRHSVRRR